MPETSFEKVLLREQDLNPQKSKNWCWLAVTEAIAKTFGPGSNWTQELIFREVALLPENASKYVDIAQKYGSISNAFDKTLLDQNSSLQSKWTYQELSKSVFDKRGSIEQALKITGNLGVTLKVQQDFPYKGQDLFGLVATEIKNGRVLVAAMQYNNQAANKLPGEKVVGVKHAMLIVGVKIRRDPKTRGRIEESVHWMNPDPKKPQLGMLRETAFDEFAKLQGIADLVSVTTTQSGASKPGGTT